MMINSKVAVVMERLDSASGVVLLGTTAEVEDGTQECCQAYQDLNFLPENESENNREGIAQAQEHIGGKDSDTKGDITSRLNLRFI